MVRENELPTNGRWFQSYPFAVKDPDYFLPAAAASHAGVAELVIHRAIDRGGLRTVIYKGEVRIPAQSLWDFRAALEEAKDAAE